MLFIRLRSTDFSVETYSDAESQATTTSQLEKIVDQRKLTLVRMFSKEGGETTEKQSRNTSV